MGRFILILTVIFIVFSLITYLLHRLLPGKRSVKYLFAAALLAAAAYQFYLSKQPSQGFEDLAQLLMALMLFTGFAGMAVTGLILDRFYPRT